MYSLAHICYICLANSANSETTNILKEYTNGIFVSDKIQCLLPEFINFLPQISKLICSKCLINIDNIYRFRQKCLQNLNILKKYLQNENKYQNNDVITTELQPIKSSKINERCEEDNSDIIQIKFENFLENRVDGFLENVEIEEKILDDLKGVKRENLDGEEKHFVDDAEVTTETNETQIESNSTFPPNLNELGNETIQSRNEAEILHSSYAEVYIKEENIDNYMPENLCQEDIANHDVTDPINKNDFVPSTPDLVDPSAPKTASLLKKRHKCPECEKSFQRRYHLKQHMRSHTGERPFQCDICEKKFSILQNLTTHKRTHTGHKPYSCEVCGKLFSNMTGLARHRRAHSSERPFKCTICEKDYAYSSNLTTHMLVHTGQKPFECTVCGKLFRQNGNLSTHMKVHSGIEPYECTVCFFKTANINSLKAHIRTHTSKKTYSCKLCDKVFAKSSSLYSHTKTHHKNI